MSSSLRAGASPPPPPPQTTVSTAAIHSSSMRGLQQADTSSIAPHHNVVAPPPAHSALNQALPTTRSLQLLYCLTGVQSKTWVAHVAAAARLHSLRL